MWPLGADNSCFVTSRPWYLLRKWGFAREECHWAGPQDQITLGPITNRLATCPEVGCVLALCLSLLMIQIQGWD